MLVFVIYIYIDKLKKSNTIKIDPILIIPSNSIE